MGITAWFSSFELQHNSDGILKVLIYLLLAIDKHIVRVNNWL